MLFPMKRRGGVACPQNILYERRGTVEPSCMLFLQRYTCRRQESYVLKTLGDFLSYEKTGYCDALKMFPTKRRGGVVPSCIHAGDKTSTVLKKLIFLTKRRGPVEPSCMLLLHILRYTCRRQISLVLASYLMFLHSRMLCCAKNHTCMSRYVHTTFDCTSPVLFCMQRRYLHRSGCAGQGHGVAIQIIMLETLILSNLHTYIDTYIHTREFPSNRQTDSVNSRSRLLLHLFQLVNLMTCDPIGYLQIHSTYCSFCTRTTARHIQLIRRSS